MQLHPVAVILLGIAFGVDRDKQELACVLVSEQVFDYEPMKVQGVGSGPGISRGSKADASPWLIGAFRAEAMRRPPRSVQFGLFLSGAKLIDDAVFLSHLRKLAPEAIGGDMEAAGLYAAANRRNTPWIVAKAICDWADGRKAQNKEMNQRTAARASTELVLDVLERGAVTRTSAPADTQRLAL